MKVEAKEQEKYLPSTIHAIWAGGYRTIPKEGIANLAQWAYLNPTFTIVLWIDSKIIPPGKTPQDFQALYVKQFTEAYLKLAKEEVIDKDISSIIQIKSIREVGICRDKEDSVDYAIDRLDPNYGLSSDVLRYRILYKYGGVYIDITDVTPGSPNKLNFLTAIPYANFGKVNEAHKLFIDHLSQTQNPSESELKAFTLNTRDFAQCSEEENELFLANTRLGNDSFICTKGNPLMLLMLQEVEKRLQCNTLDEKVMMAYGGFNKKDMTLDLSGPNVVKTIIYNSRTGSLTQNKKLTTTGYFKKISENAGSYLFSLRTDQHQVVKPPDHTRNTRYWNNIPLDITRNNTIEDIIKKIVSLASLELNQMGVLRLDDHINTLYQAASLLRIPSDKMPDFYTLFLSSIKELPLDKVEVAQCISNNPLILQFYKETKLDSKLIINTNDEKNLSKLLKIWEQCTSFGLLMGTQDFQTEKLVNITTLEIEGTLKPLEIQDIFQRIERGVNFINQIKQNMEFCPCYRDLLLLEKYQGFQKQYLNDIICKYCIVFDAYSEAFLNSDINPKDLNQFGRQLVKLAEVDQLPKRLQVMIKAYKADNINHALRIAASKGKLEDVKYLAKYADINEQGGKSQKTALHQAAANSHKEVMQYLIGYGANQELKDSDNKTAVQLTVTSSAENKK